MIMLRKPHILAVPYIIALAIALMMHETLYVIMDGLMVVISIISIVLFYKMAGGQRLFSRRSFVSNAVLSLAFFVQSAINLIHPTASLLTTAPLAFSLLLLAIFERNDSPAHAAR